MGGQTALNLAKEAEELGVWEKYNVRLIGVDIKAIDKAEDREKFRQWMIEMGISVAPARTAIVFGRRRICRKLVSTGNASIIYIGRDRRRICS
jgi:carbamoylphosphate synthase large subunit